MPTTKSVATFIDSDKNKAKKIVGYVQSFENWITCLRLRQGVGNPTNKTSIIRLRNGLRIVARRGTPDISIVWEVFASRAYSSTEELVKAIAAPCTIIDLGANIGAFSLRCANLPYNIDVHSYEPGPQNAEMLRKNLALNPHVASKISFFQEAATRDTGVAYWQFNERNPGGSALVETNQGLKVKTRSLKDIMLRCHRPVAFVKIDIEGSEYELLNGTKKQDWEQIPAVLIELHSDPSEQSSPEMWLKRMATYGFKHQSREFSSVVLRR